ncbi:hypothetical protein ACF3OC_08400 [Sphingobacterium cellulitidis]|uniref:hypothetical protein n=1 Tax=Sphingobacterium cellulitidis TaxID=1768011 RepID=UPI00370DA329
MPNTAKQEAIRKAYGEYWEQVKDELHQGMYICLIDERSSIISWNGILMTVHDFNNHLYMPKSLQGIENNNGWIRIESEEQHDEIENDYYWWYNDDNGDWEIGDKSFYGKYTHYQPIVKPEKPIY